MPRFIKKLLFLSAILAVIFGAVFHVFLTRKGRVLAREKLTRVFNRPVAVGPVRAVFPFGLAIENVEVKDLFQARKIVARLGIRDMLREKISLSELRVIDSVFELKKQDDLPLEPDEAEAEQDPDNIVIKIHGPEPGDKSAGLASSAPSTAIAVKKLVFSNCTLHFIDGDAAESGRKVTVKNINGEIKDISFPVSGRGLTSFHLAGSVPWANLKEEGKVEFSGWIDFDEKDMNAELDVVDIDGLYFYPYFKSWLDLEKANVGMARLNFHSLISGIKNDVTMDCHLELAQLEFKRKEGQEENREEKITAAIFNILQSTNQGKIEFNFKMRTKMDAPDFAFGVIKSALETKVTEAIEKEARRPGLIRTPARVVGSTLKSAAELTRALFNGTLGIGQTVTSGVKGAFDKNSREREIAGEVSRQLKGSGQ